MIKLEKIDTNSKKQVRRFVHLPYRLYQDHPYWVPPLFIDAEMQLNREKHPYYEHSDADFFIAEKDGEVVGRIGALENRRYNDYHGKKICQFYLFECINDQDVANILFNTVFEWAKERDLNLIIGPKDLVL